MALTLHLCQEMGSIEMAGWYLISVLIHNRFSEDVLVGLRVPGIIVKGTKHITIKHFPFET